MKTTLVCPAEDGDGAAGTYEGGISNVVVTGSDFDSGTVKLQASWDDGSTWLDVVDVLGDAVSFLANGYAAVHLCGTPQVRVNLTGSSGASAVTVEIHYGLANTRNAGLGIAL